MRRMVVFAAAVALVGCVPPQAVVPEPPPAQVTPVTLSASQASAVRTFILRMMKDPDSAKFGPMAAGRGADGSFLICGTINAKNSYGGYTGALPYAVWMTGDKLSLYSIASRAELAEYVYPLCTKRGLHLPI